MPETPTSPVVDAASPSRVVEAVTRWRAELAAIGGPDSLTRYQDLPEGTLDLATAHPSGLAMFLAGRPTRLSSLFRESAALSDARRRARAIRLAASSLQEEHGLAASHLGVGTVTWRDDGGETVTAPVLLRPITLHPRGAGHVDYDLDLSSTVRANPALLRLLRASGIDLDAAILESLTVAGKGFDPAPAYRHLNQVAGRLPGFALRHRLVVSTFVDLAPALVAELDRLAPDLPRHDLVAALAGDQDAAARCAGQATARGGRATDGTEDIRVLPLDRHQRAVLEAVAAGRSVRVEAPAGTGTTQLLAAVVAGFAASGRRTLLVAGHRTEAAAVADRLSTVGLPDLVAGVPAPETGGGAVPSVPSAADPSRPALAGDPVGTLRRRHDAVHARRQPWGVSALEAMHRLATLTSTDPSPRTSVRLPDDVLRRLDGATRERASTALLEAAELGAFDPRAQQAPWYAAELSTRQEGEAALAAARALARELLPALRAEMARLAGETGLATAETVTECGRQIDLLVGVRSTLDLFTPAVYERSLGTLVAATARSSWRSQRGISLGLWERRRWERHARELLRPGCSPRDLHAALAAAEEQRTQWQRLSSGGGWPRVPTGLPAADAAFAAVDAELARLEPVLAGTPGGAGLADVPLAQLQDRLERLAADEDAVTTVPARTAALRLLRDLGLQSLVDDLRERACSPDRVEAELDLAWWQSLLQQLLGADRDLAAPGGTTDEAVLADVRDAERRRQLGVVRQVRDVMPRSGPLCLATSPLALPREVPADAEADVVVLSGAHRVGAAEAVLALARARQVVVVGDPQGVPAVQVSLRPDRDGEPPVDPDPGDAAARTPVLALLDGVLPTVRLRHQHRLPARLAAAVDAVTGATRDERRLPAPPDRAELVLDVVAEGTGQPGSDGSIESVDAEVQRVVSLVLQHVRSRPEQSLAVLSTSRRHARRVADAVRAELPEHPEVARWLARPTGEPFVVADADRGEDAVRDAVILTVGFGRTPHGRVLYRFGRLDAPGGENRLALAVSRARRSLTVVTCLRGEDLDADRLRTPGSQALRSLLTLLEAPPPVAQALPGDLDDPLLDDLARRLRSAGAQPAPGSGYGPDLVVPALGGGADVAVLTDLRPATRNEDLLEQHLLVPEQLERFGWHVVRLSAVTLFTDPDAAAARVLAATRGTAP